jgi:hypothetical protein
MLNSSTNSPSRKVKPSYFLYNISKNSRPSATVYLGENINKTLNSSSRQKTTYGDENSIKKKSNSVLK